MSRSEKPILDFLCGASVRLNEVLIPPSALHYVLGRYVDNLILWNDHETFKISLIGSAIPLKFRDRYFLVCSKHQLAGCDHERVSIMTRDGQKLITSAGVRFYDGQSDSDLSDVAAFDFTEPCQAMPEIRERFFNFQGIPPQVPVEDILFLLVSGFPSTQQVYDLEDKNHVGTMKQKIVCLPDHQPSDSALLCVRPNQALSFDPDGMSGGSAFVVQRVGDGFQAHLAGMVVRAGPSSIYILKVGIIESFLTVCMNYRR